MRVQLILIPIKINQIIQGLGLFTFEIIVSFHKYTNFYADLYKTVLYKLITQISFNNLIYPAFEMEQTEIDPVQLEKRKKLWKLFGRETKAGKQLFNMYNLSDKPKINYPKTKPKSEKQLEKQKQKLAIDKKCPQKTVIDYPELPKQQGPKYHPVDLIPKRKNQTVIRKEIDQYYKRRAIDIPANRGVDRANLVKKLQDKFKMQRGILPKDATLPGLDNFAYDQEKIKQQAKLKVDKKTQNYTNPIKKQSVNKENKSMKDQLGQIFDEIVKQIDDRQQYLQEIQHLDQPKLKEKIKKQIIERIAQLQRITQLKKK